MIYFMGVLKVVTVHIGLRTCCADRMLKWASKQKSHRRRRFSWIFACCCERVNSNEGVSPVGKQTPRFSLSAVKFFCFSDTPS